MPSRGESTGVPPEQCTGITRAPENKAQRLRCGHDRGLVVAGLRGGGGKIRGGVKSDDDAFGKEDQLMVNKYAGLNFRKHELLELLKEKEEEAEGLRSAGDEIIMAGLDGPEEFQEQRQLPPGVDFRWGETFSGVRPKRALQTL